MRWGTPKDYAWLYSASLTEEYRRELLAFLPADLAAQVLKETSRMTLKPVLAYRPGCKPQGGAFEDRDRDSNS
jgi:hypothetical protein